uniref:Uncharacterized protein n=1 Tax=Anguilla anguilla TaxID=7936 RepID=A0A0E9PTG3_ANGAN
MCTLILHILESDSGIHTPAPTCPSLGSLEPSV